MARWESSHSPRPFVSQQQAQDPVPGKSPISGAPFRETKTVSPPSSARRRNQSARNLNTSRRVESVEHAKKQAQAQILMVVTQAEALDSEGKKSECILSPTKRCATTSNMIWAACY
jgi:hypothetical protein